MKKLILACICMMYLSACTHTQKTSDYLIAFEDSTKGEHGLYGYKTPDGKIVIEAQFPFVYTDTLYTTAMVGNESYTPIAIDRNGNFLLKPFIFDNGPDYLSEGLFRFEENGKMGFADKDCNIIIPAQFDFAGPFGQIPEYGKILGDKDGEIIREEMGLAEYYIGGYMEPVDDEHWIWAGWKESGYVNKSGQRFSKISHLIDGKREAWTTDGKQVFLNQKGEIIQ